MPKAEVIYISFNIMIESFYLWVLTGLLGLINFLFWSRIKRIEKDIDETRDKNVSIEKNYLKRFEEIHSKLNEVEKNIIKEFYSMQLNSLRNKLSNSKDK